MFSFIIAIAVCHLIAWRTWFFVIIFWLIVVPLVSVILLEFATVSKVVYRHVVWVKLLYALPRLLNLTDVSVMLVLPVCWCMSKRSIVDGNNINILVGPCFFAIGIVLSVWLVSFNIIRQ